MNAMFHIKIWVKIKFPIGFSLGAKIAVGKKVAI